MVLLHAPQKTNPYYNRGPNQLLFETKSDFRTVRGKSVAWFTSNCHTQGHAYQEDITNMDGHSGTSMRAFICARRERCFDINVLSNCIEREIGATTVFEKIPQNVSFYNIASEASYIYLIYLEIKIYLNFGAKNPIETSGEFSNNVNNHVNTQSCLTF